jgi:hypothetical protein
VVESILISLENRSEKRSFTVVINLLIPFAKLKKGKNDPFIPLMRVKLTRIALARAYIHPQPHARPKKHWVSWKWLQTTANPAPHRPVGTIMEESLLVWVGFGNKKTLREIHFAFVISKLI